MYAGPGEITREYADKMLLAALQEAQSVARSYDTKAQIVGVGYILALNLVLHFGDLLPTHAPIGPLFFAVVWGIVIMPILQFGQVLYPSRTRAEKELNGKMSGAAAIPPVYYVDPSSFADVRELRPPGAEVRLDLGACRRIAENLARQDHQADAVSPRPDDDRCFLRRTRRRAVFSKSCCRFLSDSRSSRNITQ